MASHPQTKHTAGDGFEFYYFIGNFQVTIECERTGYKTELEFKLRPFLGGGELTNAVSGRLKLGMETIMVIDGHWDDTVKMKDKKTGQEEVLWQVGQEQDGSSDIVR